LNDRPELDVQGPDVAKQQVEEVVREALTAAILLERCPKATIDVHCFVLECGGGEAAALVMAAGAAAADAQLDLRCTLSAACVVRLFSVNFLCHLIC
jgi:ribonuclease PH